MKSFKSIGLLVVLIAVLLFGASQSFAVTEWDVTGGSDGNGGTVNIKAYEYGNPHGQAILFIHGWSQSSQSWVKQYTDAKLLKNFRMVAMDLRGHGNSEKLYDVPGYMVGDLWADDVNAVINTLGLKKPVLVGWSYGGAVILDYLTKYGDSNIGGINFVDALGRFLGAFNDPWLLPDFYATGGQMLYGTPWWNDDQEAACRGFVLACLASDSTLPVTEPELIDTAVVYNMQADLAVRVAIVLRPGLPMYGIPYNTTMDYSDTLAAIRVPTLVTTGDSDRILSPELSEYIHDNVRGSKLSIYAGVGHSPFMEASDRFNTELKKLAEE